MSHEERIQLLQGTLDLLVLQTLVFGPQHGHGIAVSLQRTTDDELLIDHGSLYPALQRLERARLISSEWGTSDNNRRAKFYRLTTAGRRRLKEQEQDWNRLVAVMRAALTATSGAR